MFLIPHLLDSAEPDGSSWSRHSRRENVGVLLLLEPVGAWEEVTDDMGSPPPPNLGLEAYPRRRHRMAFFYQFMGQGKRIGQKLKQIIVWSSVLTRYEYNCEVSLLQWNKGDGQKYVIRSFYSDGKIMTCKCNL